MLIDLDAEGDCVFMSYKIRDYIRTTIPILSITTKGSPAYNLLSDVKTVHVVEHSKDVIFEGLKICANMTFTNEEFIEDRKAIINKYDVSNTVTNFIAKVKKILVV